MTTDDSTPGTAPIPSELATLDFDPCDAPHTYAERLAGDLLVSLARLEVEIRSDIAQSRAPRSARPRPSTWPPRPRTSDAGGASAPASPKDRSGPLRSRLAGVLDRRPAHFAPSCSPPVTASSSTPSPPC